MSIRRCWAWSQIVDRARAALPRTSLMFGARRSMATRLRDKTDGSANRQAAGGGDLCFLTSAGHQVVAQHLTACGVTHVQEAEAKQGAHAARCVLHCILPRPDGGLIGNFASYEEGGFIRVVRPMTAISCQLWWP